MWIAAFLGMMTKFSEIVLGIYFRRRNADGEWSGGPMYFLTDGLGKKKGFKAISYTVRCFFHSHSKPVCCIIIAKNANKTL
jgi:AGCS family alanine or glycine:cation symporter